MPLVRNNKEIKKYFLKELFLTIPNLIIINPTEEVDVNFNAMPSLLILRKYKIFELDGIDLI
jgi:hypothetical protein